MLGVKFKKGNFQSGRGIAPFARSTILYDLLDLIFSYTTYVLLIDVVCE